jgi:hypothetical protein
MTTDVTMDLLSKGLFPFIFTEIAPKNLRLSKPTDKTIHWKALEGHLLMVPLVMGQELMN